jgi:hypothetical protein
MVPAEKMAEMETVVATAIEGRFESVALYSCLWYLAFESEPLSVCGSTKVAAICTGSVFHFSIPSHFLCGGQLRCRSI